MSEKPKQEDELAEKLDFRQRMRQSRTLGPIYKIVVTVVGLVVIAAGIVMLVFPGPGWAAIILGLVILAPEYRWAQWLLDPIKRFAEKAAERALDPRRRKQNLLLAALAVVLAGLVVWAYLARYGPTIEPFPFL